MGLYSGNRINSIGEQEIVAAEGYFGPIGAHIALIESAENDMAIFNAAIQADFTEAAMVFEGASESDLQVYREGVIMDSFEKLKEFFRNLIKKIEGIFKAVIAKFESIFVKDNRDLYKKYASKLSGDFKNFKCKYAKPKSGGIPEFKVADIPDYEMTGTLKDLTSKKEDFESDDRKIEIWKRLGLDISEAKNFKKEFHEHCFEDDEVVDGWNSGEVASAIAPLKEKSDIERLKNQNKKLKEAIAKIIKDIDKSSKAVNAASSKGTASSTTLKNKVDFSTSADKERSIDATYGANDVKEVQAWLGLAHLQAVADQAAFITACSATISETKFLYSQARRVMAAAISYASIPSKKKNEGALDPDYVNAIQEAAEYEFDVEFDSATTEE